MPETQERTLGSQKRAPASQKRALESERRAPETQKGILNQKDPLLNHRNGHLSRRKRAPESQERVPAPQIRDPEAARGPSPGARSPTEGEGPQGQQEQQGQQGDGQPGAWHARQRSVSGYQGDPPGDFTLGDTGAHRCTSEHRGTPSLEEMFFPGAWWHGRVGRMRSLGERHFRPCVVERALLLQEDHPLRLCTILRPLSDRSRDLRVADHLCTQYANNICADCGGPACDWREDDLEVQHLSST